MKKNILITGVFGSIKVATEAFLKQGAMVIGIDIVPPVVLGLNSLR